MPTLFIVMGLNAFAGGICLFAFWQGGRPERIATLLILVNMMLWAVGETLVRRAQERGEVKSREDPRLIARHIFFTYSASLRWWIAEAEPHPEAGMKELRRLLTLQVEGLKGRSPR